MRPWGIKVEIVGLYVVLSRLRRPKLRPRSNVHEVVIGFLGLIWILGRKAVSLSGLKASKF